MTLLDVIDRINAAALSQPQVGEVVENDIYKLNARKDAAYGVFGWIQGMHRGSVTGETTGWSFTLVYADRLTADRSNEKEVQSVGAQVLRNVLMVLYEQGIVPEGYTMQAFTQRFSDECAGMMCNVVLDALNDDICATNY